MHGPTREHVDGDPYQDDPRVVMPFNGMSPSGDVEAEVVYANYGTPEDFEKLDKMKVDVRGKIVLVRYGQNFRGVKVFVAQEHGAAGVHHLLRSCRRRLATRRQISRRPVASRYRRAARLDRIHVRISRRSHHARRRIPSVAAGFASASLPSESPQMPKIPVHCRISYHDAWPHLATSGRPESPREWQGSLPFTYHVGPGPVKVKMHLKQDYQFRTIWDVIGRVRGSELPDEWVVAGNHRDAWVYGAVDPNSGTAAMLEACTASANC